MDIEQEGLESASESSGAEESQSSGSESSSSAEPAAQAAAPKQQDEIDWTKAFEHPRFKELVDQKNKATEFSRSLELKLAQLEGRLQTQPNSAQQAQRDELIEDLKKIDPRLASRLEAFGNSSKTVEQLQAKLEQFEKSQQQSSQQATVKEAVSRINQWHDTNKVNPTIKAAINAQLDVMYMHGKLNSQNLEQAYNDAFKPYKDYEESLKRETLKGYASQKQADAKVPTSQPKGAPAKKPAPQQQQFKNKDELKAAMVREYVAKRAAEKEASSA